MIWRGTYDTYLNKIKVSINNFLRLILCVPRNKNKILLIHVDMYNI